MDIEIFDYQQHTDSKIIVYGTVAMKMIVTWCLNDIGLEVFEYANREGNYVTPYMNISAEELRQLVSNDSKVVVLFAEEYSIRSEIQFLDELGVNCLYSVRKLIDNSRFEKENKDEFLKRSFDNRSWIYFLEDSVRYKDQLFIKSIDAVVTERCSLKCESCSNLMQYYKTPKNFDIIRLCDYIRIIVDKTYKLHALRILGGEPFLNLDFVKIIDEFKDCDYIDNIEIYTNATVFPKEEILEKLKNPKVEIILSDYHELSRKLSEWTKWCQQNSVRFVVTKMDVWQDCGNLERHDYTVNELKDIYGNCVCRNIPTIIGNKLYNCAYGANAANLGAMYKNECDKDYLEIDRDLTTKQIDDFLYNREYLESCRYCNGRNPNRARIVPHVQIPKALEYKRLESSEIEMETMEENILQCSDKVSVIVPVYNMEQYIERCLKSLVSQTYENLEIIVIDDGSTDNSVKICESFKNRNIKIIKICHKGVAAARKRGIKEASGIKTIWVDADDYIDDDYIEKMVNRMKDCDLICSEYWEEDKNKRVTDSAMDRGQAIKTIKKHEIPLGVYMGADLEILIRYMFKNPIYKIRGVLWGKIFETRLLKESCDLVDDMLWMSEDRLILQLYMLKCNKVSFVDECGYHYCVRPANNRYPWNDAVENSTIVMNILKDAVKGRPNEKSLTGGIMEDFMSFNDMALKLMGKSWEYYYPYYGRLDGKRVVLYGAGNVGRSYYRQLLEDKSTVFVAWVDKNADELHKKELLPVQPISVLDDLRYDAIIVAVAAENTFLSIREELIERGVLQDRILWNKTK